MESKRVLRSAGVLLPSKHWVFFLGAVQASLPVVRLDHQSYRLDSIDTSIWDAPSSHSLTFDFLKLEPELLMTPSDFNPELFTSPFEQYDLGRGNFFQNTNRLTPGSSKPTPCEPTSVTGSLRSAASESTRDVQAGESITASCCDEQILSLAASTRNDSEKIKKRAAEYLSHQENVIMTELKIAFDLSEDNQGLFHDSFWTFLALERLDKGPDYARWANSQRAFWNRLSVMPVTFQRIRIDPKKRKEQVFTGLAVLAREHMKSLEIWPQFTDFIKDLVEKLEGQRRIDQLSISSGVGKQRRRFHRNIILYHFQAVAVGLHFKLRFFEFIVGYTTKESRDPKDMELFIFIKTIWVMMANMSGGTSESELVSQGAQALLWPIAETAKKMLTEGTSPSQREINLSWYLLESWSALQKISDWKYLFNKSGGFKPNIKKFFGNQVLDFCYSQLQQVFPLQKAQRSSNKRQRIDKTIKLSNSGSI